MLRTPNQIAREIMGLPESTPFDPEHNRDEALAVLERVVQRGPRHYAQAVRLARFITQRKEAALEEVLPLASAEQIICLATGLHLGGCGIRGGREEDDL